VPSTRREEDVHSTRERGCISLLQRGCVRWLAGRAAPRMGKWRVDSCSCREFRLEEKAKAKIGKAKAGLFYSPGLRAFITHTHVESIEFITEQRIRHRHLRQYLLAGLMHCCCFCWISGQRNGRRFVVCMSTCVCAAAIPVPDRSVLL
jgi:hypothetical protein